MDGAALPHAQSTIAYRADTMTELDVECIHPVTAFVDIDSTLLHRPTAAGF